MKIPAFLLHSGIFHQDRNTAMLQNKTARMHRFRQLFIMYIIICKS